MHQRSPKHFDPKFTGRGAFAAFSTAKVVILEEVKYGCRVFQKNFDWFVSYNDQVASFWDGMILIDADSLQIA